MNLHIHNRRYTGSKYKLMPWIKTILAETCGDSKTFFDVFGGTGIVTAESIDLYDELTINDFLFSNEVIYRGFFEQKSFSANKLNKIKKEYSCLDVAKIDSNYAAENYGDKYFSFNDAKLIGHIRDDLEKKKQARVINKKEYYILLASLLYSLDRIANTVGHYEAFIQHHESLSDAFVFNLIDPIVTEKRIHIFREDSNRLCRKVSADIAFVDPPYNSRQYSRFYHVLETIAKWDMPSLRGVAMKPPEENMSDYCRVAAPRAFEDLINNLNVSYIVVTYNNTYTSKSTSSQNKIKLEQVEEMLGKRGAVKVFDHAHNAFNAGKTDLNNHREYLFVCTVGKV